MSPTDIDPRHRADPGALGLRPGAHARLAPGIERARVWNATERGGRSVVCRALARDALLVVCTAGAGTVFNTWTLVVVGGHAGWIDTDFLRSAAC